MSHLRVQASTLPVASAAARPAGDRQEYSLAEAIGWGAPIGLWIARARERRALARLNGHLLQDIGVSPEEAAGEAAKPFWQ